MKKTKFITFFLIIAVIANINSFQRMHYPDEYSKNKDLKMSVQDITLITPENKTYTEPMSGYYPSTFGFESDIIGNEGNETSFINRYESDSSSAYIRVVDEMNGHKNVIQLYDGTSVGSENFYGYHDFQTNIEYGTIEFWVLNKEYSGDQSGVYYNFGNESGQEYIDFSSFNSIFTVIIDSDNSGLVYFRTGNGLYNWAGLYSDDTWYHIRIDFESTSGGYLGLSQYRLNFWFNSVRLLENEPLMIDESLGVIATHSHGFDNTRHDYLDAIGFSWDPNYNIGDNLQEGMLVSFENSSALDWVGYSLDGHANRTILGNTTIPIPDYGVHNIQIFGNDTFGTYHQSDLVYFSYVLFGINSPENIAYTRPMSGYYPATHGFENEVDGTSGTDIRFVDVDLSGSGCTASVISSSGDHKKILQLNDNSGSADVDIRTSFDSNLESGTIEWYWRSTNVGYSSYFDVHNSGSTRIRIGIWNNYLNYWDGTNHNIVGISSNTWYHLRIDFESDTGGYEGLSAGTYYIYLNGVKYGPYNFASDVDYVDGIRISTHDTQTGYKNYIDALGFSWDANYNIGDNLNEGLLVSFENSTVLDWVGYSLDGQANRTILGNTTIPIPDDGSHTIQLFGIDSIGAIYESVIRNFEVDVTPPIISINTPTVNQHFGTFAPDFDISIIELNLHTTWYTIDNGVTNITFTGFTGTINQIEWDKAGAGSIMIRFYANDTVSHENFIDIIVFKEFTSVIIGPGINFLLIFIMIGTFSLLGIVVFSLVYKNVYKSSKKPKHRKVKVKKVKKVKSRKKIVKNVEIFCPFCNSVITNEQKFCRYCGSNLKEAENN